MKSSCVYVYLCMFLAVNCSDVAGFRNVIQDPTSLKSEVVWHQGSMDGVSIKVKTDFSAEISVGDEIWLSTDEVAVVVNHSLRSLLQGSLEQVGAPFQSSGKDSVGIYKSISTQWTVSEVAHSNYSKIEQVLEKEPLLETSYRMYIDNHTIGFQQKFLRKIEGFSVSGDEGVATLQQWGTPGSGFPSFRVNGSNSNRLYDHQQQSYILNTSHMMQSKSALEAGELGYVSYGEIGRVRVGRFPLGYKSSLNEMDGIPLALTDKSGRAVVLAPSDNFFDSVAGLVDQNGISSPHNESAANTSNLHNLPSHLRFGLIGTASYVPANTTTLLLMRASHIGNGLTEAFISLGDILLHKGGRKLQRTSSNANAQVQKIGYSTVGHYFYGLHKNLSVADTMLAVQSAAKTQGIKFGYFLVDSFWYREGDVPFPNSSASEPIVSHDRICNKIANLLIIHHVTTFLDWMLLLFISTC